MTTGDRRHSPSRRRKNGTRPPLPLAGLYPLMSWISHAVAAPVKRFVSEAACRWSLVPDGSIPRRERATGRAVNRWPRASRMRTHCPSGSPSPGPGVAVASMWRRIGAGVSPGLQIRWWSARVGHGGFDSHTLPPKSLSRQGFFEPPTVTAREMCGNEIAIPENHRLPNAGATTGSSQVAWLSGRRGFPHQGDDQRVPRPGP